LSETMRCAVAAMTALKPHEDNTNDVTDSLEFSSGRFAAGGNNNVNSGYSSNVSETPDEDFLDLFMDDEMPAEALRIELLARVPDSTCDPTEQKVTHKNPESANNLSIFLDRGTMDSAGNDVPSDADPTTTAYKNFCLRRCANWKGGQPAEHPLPPTPPRTPKSVQLPPTTALLDSDTVDLVGDDDSSCDWNSDCLSTCSWTTDPMEIASLFEDADNDAHPFHDPSTTDMATWPNRQENLMILINSLCAECIVPLQNLLRFGFPLGYDHTSIRDLVFELYSDLRQHTSDARLKKQTALYESKSDLFFLILFSTTSLYHHCFPNAQPLGSTTSLDQIIDLQNQNGQLFDCLATVLITLTASRFMLRKLRYMLTPGDKKLRKSLHNSLFGGTLAKQLEIALNLRQSFGHLSAKWFDLASNRLSLLDQLPGKLVPPCLSASRGRGHGAPVAEIATGNLFSQFTTAEHVDVMELQARITATNVDFNQSSPSDCAILTNNFLPMYRGIINQLTSINCQPKLADTILVGSVMPSDVLVNRLLHLQTRPIEVPFALSTSDKIQLAPVLCYNDAPGLPFPTARFYESDMSYYDSTFDVRLVDPSTHSFLDVILSTPVYACLSAVRIRHLEDLSGNYSAANLLPEQPCLIWDVKLFNPLVSVNNTGGSLSRYHGHLIANSGDNQELTAPLPVSTGWDGASFISIEGMMNMIVAADCILVSAENDSSIFQDITNITNYVFDSKKSTRMTVRLEELANFRRYFPLSSKDRAVRGIVRNPNFANNNIQEPEFVETWVFRRFGEICDAARTHFDIFPRSSYLHTMSASELRTYCSEEYLHSQFGCSPLFSFERFGVHHPARDDYESLPIGKGKSYILRTDDCYRDNSLTRFYNQGIIHSDTTSIEHVMGWNEPLAPFPILYDTSAASAQLPDGILLEALMVVETRSSAKKQALNINTQSSTTEFVDEPAEFNTLHVETVLIDSDRHIAE